MKLIYKDSQFFDANKRTWSHLKLSRSKLARVFNDLMFVEIRRKRPDGLFNRYVWIFHNGENITPLVGLFLKIKSSKSKQYCGALASSSCRFYLSDCLIEELRRSGYSYFEKMLLSLATDRLVRIEK